MEATRQLTIEYTRLTDIRPDPDNPKDHDLGALSESLARFGFVAPMGVNEITGMLIWGHGRLSELKRLRASHDFPPEGVAVDEDGEWLVPVIRGIELSEKDGRAYLVTDNRIGELGGWHEAKLIETLVQVGGPVGRGLRGTGYDGDDLDRLIIEYGRPDNMDELAEAWGPPDPTEFWPILRLKLDPETYKRYEMLMAQAPGAEEWQKFKTLLDQCA